jgi:hypothetical protein
MGSDDGLMGISGGLGDIRAAGEGYEDGAERGDRRDASQAGLVFSVLIFVHGWLLPFRRPEGTGKNNNHPIAPRTSNESRPPYNHLADAGFL